MGKRTASVLLLMMSLAGLFTTNAQTKMIVKTNDGSGYVESEHLLGDVIKWQTSGSDFTVYKKGGNVGFALQNIVSIKFFSPSSLDMPTCGSEGELELYYAGGRLGAKGLYDSAAQAAVYDVSGRAILLADEWNGEEIDVTGLAKGVYIFKVNNKTLKFIN